LRKALHDIETSRCHEVFAIGVLAAGRAVDLARGTRKQSAKLH
jgi:hypothetical protein